MRHQLKDVQDYLKLIVSILVGDDAKKGEKIDKSKCSQQKSLQRKDDDVSDGENKDRTSHMSHKDGQLKSDGKASDKPTSHDQERNKNRKTTLYYKDPKIQALDVEITKRLSMRDDPGVDSEKLKKEDERLAA